MGRTKPLGHIVQIGPNVYSLDDPHLLRQDQSFPVATRAYPPPCPQPGRHCSTTVSTTATDSEDQSLQPISKPGQWTMVTQILDRNLDSNLDMIRWQQLWDEIETVTHTVSHPFPEIGLSIHSPF